MSYCFDASLTYLQMAHGARIDISFGTKGSAAQWRRDGACTGMDVHVLVPGNPTFLSFSRAPPAETRETHVLRRHSTQEVAR